MVLALPERPAAERARARSVWQHFRSSGLLRERFGVSWEPSGAPRTPKSAQERPKRQPKRPKSHFKSHRRRARVPQGRPRSDQGGPKERSERARELPERVGRDKIDAKAVTEAEKVDFVKSAPRSSPLERQRLGPPQIDPKSAKNRVQAACRTLRATSSVDFGRSKVVKAGSIGLVEARRGWLDRAHRGWLGREARSSGHTRARTTEG